jgi:predicted PurR-regulated permease PerM
MVAEEKKRFKTGLILITYAVILYVLLSNPGVVVWFLGNMLRIIKPFIYGIATAYILNILMRLFEKLYGFLDKSKKPLLRKAKRPLSILSVFTSLLVIVYVFMVFAIPQLSLSAASLASEIPAHIGWVEDFLNRTIEGLGLTGGFWKGISLNWNEIVRKAGEFITDTVPMVFAFTRDIAAFFVNIATGILISIYLLAAKEKLIAVLRKLVCAWLPKRISNRLIDSGVMANRIFMGYFSGMIVNALLMGIICFLGAVILGFPYAFLLSVIIGVMALIPIIGAVVGSVLGLVVVLLVMPGKALLFLIFVILLQEIDSLFIYPRIVGRSIGLGGLWILVALILGGSLFGIIGVIAGIPALAAVYAIVRKATERRLEKKDCQ